MSNWGRDFSVLHHIHAVFGFQRSSCSVGILCSKNEGAENVTALDRKWCRRTASVVVPIIRIFLVVVCGFSFLFIKMFTYTRSLLSKDTTLFAWCEQGSEWMLSPVGGARMYTSLRRSRLALVRSPYGVCLLMPLPFHACVAFALHFPGAVVVFLKGPCEPYTKCNWKHTEVCKLWYAKKNACLLFVKYAHSVTFC